LTPGRLVIDSSPLNYFARSNQLDLLPKLLSGADCCITRAVEEELLRGGPKHAQLYQAAAQPWITVVDETSLEYLGLFSEYHGRLGRGTRNIGEATVLAYAEFHGITAMVDDRVGRRHGTERGVSITGTLEVLCTGIRGGILSPIQAAAVVDLLRDHEAYLPCDGSGFVDWARAEGLLEPPDPETALSAEG
jgi:predicted nucleic acid-binding protein